MLSHFLNHAEVLLGNLRATVGWEEVLDFVNVVEQERLVSSGNGQYVVSGEVAKHARLNLNLLGVDFPLNFVAGFQLDIGEYAGAREHFHAFGLEIRVEDERSGCLAIKTTLCSFFFPLVAVAITIEVNRLGKSDEGFHLGENSVLKSFSCSYALVNGSLELAELVGNGSVEGNHC